MLMDFLLAYDAYPSELTLKQASIATGFPEYTLRQAIKMNALTHYSIGHRYLVPKASLRGFVLSKVNIGEQDDALFEFLGQGDTNG